MSDWQPIDTAPKTKQQILVWCPERRNTYGVCWSINYGYTKDMDEETWMHFGALNRPLSEIPSHWMSIPPPPE